ncbi:MAG: hypothetical protein QF673_02630 [Candidatus Hydrothermarchaeota archaeon]|nr:hypothetical protein [Candidatus Hydrothermarchaeota archaeon]
MKRVPRGYWKNKENRVEGIRWLVEKTGKKPNEIISRDFYKNKLSGVLSYYSGSPFRALKDADFNFK